MLNNRWAILGLLLVVRVAMGFQFQSVAAVAPLLSADLGLDHAGVGTLVGFYMLPGIVIAIPGGFLGSRFPDLRMVAVGVLMMATGGAICSLDAGYAVLATGRLVAGAGAVIQGIFVVKMIADWFEGREMITALAVMLSGFPVGIALALPVAGALAENFGWQLAMAAGAAGCSFALVLLVLFYRPAPMAEAAPVGSGSFSIPMHQLVLVVAGALLWSFYNISYFSYLSFGPAMLIERGMPLIDAGLVISLSSWASMLAVPIGGMIAERSGRPATVLVIGCVVAGLSAVAMPIYDYPYLFSIMIGVFAAVPAGVIMAAAAGVVSSRHRAQANGIIYTFFYGGMGICPAVAGWTADISGTAASPVYLSGAVLLATAALYPLFRVATRGLRAMPA